MQVLGHRPTDVVLVVGIKYQHVALEETQPTSDVKSELQSPHSDENECCSREQAIGKLPDIVCDVKEYLSKDASFVHTSSLDVGKDVEETWSKEVLSSVRSLEEQLASIEPRGYWNSNDKDCADETIVTINPMYNNESDVSSRSSLEDQFEVLSVGDACSRGKSSVSEPIDLSDTEQPLFTDESTGRFESSDRNAEQVLSTEMFEHPYVPPVEPSSERSCTSDQVITDGEVLQELDAYLSSAVESDDHQCLDGDNLRKSIENAAANDDDDAIENSFGSKDDNDVINIIGTTADMNDVEQDLDQTASTTDHSSVVVPASCSAKNLYRDANDDADDDAGDVTQFDNDIDVSVETKQWCRVDNAVGFLGNQTVVKFLEHRDFNTAPDIDQATEVHEETAEKDLDESVDRRDLVENSSSTSPNQFAVVTLHVSKDKTCHDAVPSDCHSKELTTELVGDDIKMADAEVDAIFNGTVDGSLDDQDRCRIRLISDDEADAVDPVETDSCVQLLQTSDTSDTDDFMGCGVTAIFPATHKELHLAQKERLETDNEIYVSDTNEDNVIKANRMNLPHVCTSETSDIEEQFERDRTMDVARVGEGQDAGSIGIKQLEVNNNYILDEYEAESDETSSDLEMSFQVAPSYKVHEACNEGDSEVANCTVQAVAPAYITTPCSPCSNLSWHSCSSSTVCKPENTEAHIISESVPNLRGVTAPQVAAYRKFCEDRLNIATSVDHSDKMENTLQSEPEDEVDGSTSFPYVDAIDVLPSDNLDSKTRHTLLNNNSLLPECHHSDFSEGRFGTENSVQQNKCVEMKVKENETSVEESFPVDEDLDEIGECSPDTADSCISLVDIDVTLTNFASECSKTLYYLCWHYIGYI